VVLAGLLHRLPRQRLCQLLLLVRPDTVLRWHRDQAAPCRDLRAEAARTPAHGPLDPRPGPAPGPREPLMGVPQNPRRARRHGHQGRRLDRLGNPAGARRCARAATAEHDPGPTSRAARRTRCWPATSSRHPAR
jgi:hypothetical protein